MRERKRGANALETETCFSPFPSICKIDHMISAAGEASYYYKDYKLISGFFSRAQGQMAVSMSLWLVRGGATYSVAEFTAVNSQLSI